MSENWHNVNCITPDLRKNTYNKLISFIDFLFYLEINSSIQSSTLLHGENQCWVDRLAEESY